MMRYLGVQWNSFKLPRSWTGLLLELLALAPRVLLEDQVHTTFDLLAIGRSRLDGTTRGQGGTVGIGLATPLQHLKRPIRCLFDGL